MRGNLFFLIGLIMTGCGHVSDPNASTSETKTILLHQLKTTHNEKEWFVPVNTALEGLTAEQAMWRDSSGNHSVGQLAYHLAFWNENVLADFKGLEKKNPESNEETFNNFNPEEWNQLVARLDSILTEMEKAVEESDEAKLKDWYPTLANVSVHNAYHTGQIIYVRKEQGSWDPEKGVK